LLCCIVSPGQAGDSPVLPELLAELRVNSHLPGRPRTTPISVRGDKAYSSRGHRALLRSRGIRAVIPEPADQVANRKRRGCAGGRPVSFDAEDYEHRNVVERFFNPDEELARQPLRQARRRLSRQRRPRRDRRLAALTSETRP